MSAQTAPAAPPVTLPASAPPGPYVLDIRGSTIGIPKSGAFFPDVSSTITVPARGFGFDIGGHLYPWQLGPARVGVGVNLARARGSASTPPSATPPGSTSGNVSTAGAASPGVTATVTTVAPQVSFNFGTSEGWSYLSAGYGTGHVSSAVSGITTGAASGATRATGTLGSLNVGGGARWFISSHAAVAFDVRMHRMSAGSAGATPAFTLVSASVGLSLR